MITLNLGDHYRIQKALKDAADLIVKEKDLHATILNCRRVLEEEGIRWDKEFMAMHKDGDNRLAKLHRAEATLADYRRQIVETLTAVVEPLWTEWWAVTKVHGERTLTTDEDGLYQRISSQAIWVMEVLESLVSPEEYQRLSRRTGEMGEEDIEILFKAEKLPQEPVAAQLSLLGEEMTAGVAR